jgi:hypothetical protein
VLGHPTRFSVYLSENEEFTPVFKIISFLGGPFTASVRQKCCEILHAIQLINLIPFRYYCVEIHNAMSDYERKKIELELKTFTSRNFVRPSECRNLEQIRFYVRELCLKIDEFEGKFNYVPNSAYSLLAQYNSRQNAMINVDFRNSYNRI